MNKRVEARILNAARIRAGLTVNEMCARAGIVPATYHDHIRKRRLTMEELSRIDKVLYLTDEDIVGIIRGRV